MDTKQLKRIADAIEEILRLVKKDMKNENYTLAQILSAWTAAYGEDMHEEYPGFIQRLQEEKMTIRSKHNDLLNYFIHDARDLSPAYVKKCERFLWSLRNAGLITKQAANTLYRLQASSNKRQAASVKQLPQLNDIKIMKVKEAKAITGGLTYTTKMPGPSYNTPASRCITGARLRKVPGSVCSSCYALKGNYKRFPKVEEALERRFQSLKHQAWVPAMATLIKKHKYFRWHDAGDIQSMVHLENIFEVCRLTPDTSHWMPTREAKFLNLMDPDIVPSNLIIRMSSHMIDQQPVTFWPWTSTVTSGHDASCPAPKQGNKCGDCRACWDRSVSTVSYGKH